MINKEYIMNTKYIEGGELINFLMDKCGLTLIESNVLRKKIKRLKVRSI
mgnify:CR=1 FL=1|tara:strand:+ start:612 stop:758 length:147 start_codon:yes stop_codon:yes gene_type:complete